MRRFSLLGIMAIVATAAVLSVGQVRAADPTPIEDAATTSITLTNVLGRAYDLEAFAVKSRGDTATTCTVVISVINIQDSDLTGTNATDTAVTYTIKSSGNYTSGWDWNAKADTTDLVRVPSGAALKLTFTGGLTNDFLIFRDDADD